MARRARVGLGMRASRYDSLGRFASGLGSAPRPLVPHELPFFLRRGGAYTLTLPTTHCVTQQKGRFAQTTRGAVAMSTANSKPTLSGDGMRIVISCLEDARRLIAAGKVQRWEVLKWTVTVNLALAGVTVWVEVKWPVATVALAVMVLSWYLLHHYNRRVEGARKTASRIEDHLDTVDAQAGQLCGRDVCNPVKRDRREVYVFCLIVTLSTIPALLRAGWPT